MIIKFDSMVEELEEWAYGVQDALMKLGLFAGAAVGLLVVLLVKLVRKVR